MKTRAIYSGSFDPIHNGHLDVIVRAASIFDLEVVVANNPAKNYLLDLLTRRRLVEAVLSPLNLPVRCLPEGSLLVDFARTLGIKVMVKGVRGSTDYDYERALHQINNSQWRGVETVLIIGDPSLQHVSSTAVKELAKLGGHINEYVNLQVAITLKSKLGLT